ncbi:hypothetical protein [Haloechinothrix sp. LS1_15]|uniref:hypothetical protein n=1 Tax=Haloechinothrix sp. LS1_15 TaxID=2652248 RepID=UPI002944C8CC|nr:hypothetical protein [Haloechinothrix sp. LS1_15]MDV6011661.1 hypothetical protein [Haloechinothrix sp. LS1_15]
MLAEDRDFLARISRVHRTVSESFFALADGSLSPETAAWIGKEYTAIGEEFTRRAQRATATVETTTIDGEYAAPECRSHALTTETTAARGGSPSTRP